MDISNEFAAVFAGASFGNQERFYDALKRVGKETGTYYDRVSRQCHPDGTVEKLIFDFKHAQFACSKRNHNSKGTGHSNGTACTARFTVSSTRSFIRVLKFDMRHNHGPEVSHDESKRIKREVDETVCNDAESALLSKENNDEHVVADLNMEFRNMFLSVLFSSFKELQNQMNLFMQKTGSVYIMRNTVKMPQNMPNIEKLVYKSVAFECLHFGTYRSYATIRRNQRTVKFGCRSKIYFYCHDQKFSVGKYEVKHNHELTPNSEPMRPKRKQKKMPTPIKDQLEEPLVDNRIQSCKFKEVPEKLLSTAFENEFQPEFSCVNQTQNNSRRWLDVPDEIQNDIPSVLASPHNLTRRLINAAKPVLSPIMLTQMQITLNNLKKLALSSGGSRLATCLRELMFLEAKWRVDFAELEASLSSTATTNNFEVPSTNSLFNVNINTESPTTSVTSSSYQHNQRRRKRLLNQTKPPEWFFSSNFDIEQSGMFDSSAAELIPRPWFYD